MTDVNQAGSDAPQAPKQPRRMLQPTKDEIRASLAASKAKVQNLSEIVYTLHLKLASERRKSVAMFCVALVVGTLFGIGIAWSAL